MTETVKFPSCIAELPLTQLLQPNFNSEWVDVWSAYPYSTTFQMYNRFFLSNDSFEYDKPIIPKVTDLNGLPVIGAFIHYPPYTAYYHVVSHDISNMLHARSKLTLKYFCSQRAREMRIYLIPMSHWF